MVQSGSVQAESPKPYNILIGICSGGTIRAETVSSLVGAIDYLKKEGIDSGLQIRIGNFVDHNRNILAREAREHGCSHIMFIDSDMDFPPSGILRLLHHDKDIVGGMYNARGVPGKPLVSTVKMSDDYTSGATQEIEFPRQLFKCYGLGMGFCLIRTSVFDTLATPWFKCYEDEKGDYHGEDIEFCIKAIKEGFDVWCSPSIPLGHIGTYTY